MDAAAGTNRSKSLTALGFLSIVERQPLGVVGGYLLVSPKGRPLEFHCSAPIIPNKAQEILYGPTLRPFLHGELIGRSLVEHAKLSALCIFVDSLDTLALQDAVSVPVAAVVTPDNRSEYVADPGLLPHPRLHHSDGSEQEYNGDREAKERTAISCPQLPGDLHIGEFHLTTAPGYDSKARDLQDQLHAVVDALDLLEPFERIHAAIEEAHRMSA